VENEHKIVAHIKELGKAGFTPERRTVHSIAYRFAVDLNLPHKFNNEEKLAGSNWLRSFMYRNLDLPVRQSEGVSVARAQRMNREDVNNYFKILQSILVENDLLSKPQKI
jgi:hypothetical protein